jgi:hypothetical protein
MEAQEKENILRDLQSGRSELLVALSGMNDTLATRTPSHGKWSVLECVEHLAISEAYLLSQICSSQHSDAPLLNRQREALLVARGSDRTIAISAPEVALPIGRFPTLSDALKHFLESRERTITFVEQNTHDLRLQRTSHPLIGDVNCYELLLMIAVHLRRHVKQIEEIRSVIN